MKKNDLSSRFQGKELNNKILKERDFRSSLFLPKTDFPMKAGLRNLEPKLLARWEDIKLYEQLRDSSHKRDKFVLHDGPPYANGHLHMGHALNKILKDVIVRSYQMLGYDSNYVPGWDCHGLPIEWKIEESYRKKGKKKESIPVLEFRKECRDFAKKWVEQQKTEFKRLGIIGDWNNPYTTMSNMAEASIVREIGKFVLNGGLYKGSKPVLWSVVEKTALADAEVEYQEHNSMAMWVKFPILNSQVQILENSSVIIWTTTPWTLPANRAIAFGGNINYCLLEAVKCHDSSLLLAGDRIIVAESLLDQMVNLTGIIDYLTIKIFPGKDLNGTKCQHCLHEDGYDFEVPLHHADFVNLEQGTGFVHIAPGHGEDDFSLGKSVGLEIPETVNGDGLYYDNIPLFAGKHVFKVNSLVADALRKRSRLVHNNNFSHSYPHSWRSKAPLIYRNTPQWFISMHANSLRDKALSAIDNTKWIPSAGYRRIRSMVESRPDWCISRQRQWGVPITIFVNKKSGEILKDPEVFERIADTVEREGSDIWFSQDPRNFLSPNYDSEDWEPVKDIVEVWFDSGSTHAFVLEERSDLKWPADLYVEGSDQHRGWFHTSLLESCGTRNRAPYNAVLTHGFVLDEKNRKMSKSTGNVLGPLEVINDFGSDILRLWVVSSDYSQDMTIGPSILKQSSDLYRRIRNTFRFLLGNLDGFTPKEKLDLELLPELERWVLHRLWSIDNRMRESCKSYDFNGLFMELHNFCTVDLSAFYFDVRKDSLYCDKLNSNRRRAVRTVLDELFNYLARWLAPFICFTAEEVWLSRYPSEKNSIHLQQFPEVPNNWRNDDIEEKWNVIKSLRRCVTAALEQERAMKNLGSSLQAHPIVKAPKAVVNACKGIDIAEVCITSKISIIEGEPSKDQYIHEEFPEISVLVESASGEKCARCWKVLPEVGEDHGLEICSRCYDVIR